MPSNQDYINNIRYFLGTIKDASIKATYEYELKLLIQLESNGFEVKGDLKHLLWKVKAISINQ